MESCANCASRNIRALRTRTIDHMDGLVNTKFMCDECGYEFEIEHKG